MKSATVGISGSSLTALAWRLAPSWLVVGPVAIAGAAAVVWALPRLPAARLAEVAVLFALAGLSQTTSIRLFRSSSISIAFAFAVGALVSIGPAAAVVVQLGPGLVSSVTPHRKPPRKALFNLTSLPLQTWLAGLVYRRLGGPIAPDDLAWSLLVPVVAASLVFVVANTVGLALVIALDSRTAPWAVWRLNYRWLVPNYVGLGLVGLGLAVTARAIGFGALAIFAIPLAMAWYSFQLYMAQTLEIRRRNLELEVARAAVEASEERYRLLAEAIPQIVWTARPDGTRDYYNQRWRDYTGLSAAATLAQGWDAALHPDDVQRCHERWEEAVRTGAVYESECRFLGADGVYRWHLGRALPLRDAQERIVGWFGTCTDIDDQKRAVEETERALRLRDEFLSLAAHELKTPVAGLQLGADLALKYATAPVVDEGRVARMLAIVVDQTDRLARLVDRLLDVSRLELNKLVLERAESDLAGLVRGVAASIQALAPNHRVEVRSPERTLAFVDALRVEQVVSNLLDNAIKFSPASDRVEVEVFCPAEEVVGVAVRDWGPGIPAEHRPHVFGRLYQAHAATRQSGMGLGLYVSRQIAELHGGALEAEFPSDGGTRFVLTIPTAGGVDPTAPGTIRERCLALSSR